MIWRKGKIPPGIESEKKGGRKRLIDINPQVGRHFLDILREHTAGDPMRSEIKWTNLTRREISAHLAARGTPAGRRIIKQLMKRHGYVKRQALKSQIMGPRHPNRNAQFENIAELKREYLDAGDPVLSIDAKKKELLGNFYRDGKLHTRESIKVFDHDFPSAASGVVIPHGIYDVRRNQGHINLGTSHETSEFACDSFAHWWRQYGQALYPNAKRVLLLCDGGGSNSANRYLFKEELQKLADQLKLAIRVAHYPPYCSKYNPIEHRLFPHVTRACQGVVFHTVEIVRDLVARTTTSTGLGVTVDILNKACETGKKYARGFKQNMRILFDAHLPKWNYQAVPTIK